MLCSLQVPGLYFRQPVTLQFYSTQALAKASASSLLTDVLPSTPLAELMRLLGTKQIWWCHLICQGVCPGDLRTVTSVSWVGRDPRRVETASCLSLC